MQFTPIGAIKPGFRVNVMAKVVTIAGPISFNGGKSCFLKIGIRDQTGQMEVRKTTTSE